MLRRWRAEIIAFVAALAVGAGAAFVFGIGRTSDEDRVREAAKAYLTAFADEDPVALCGAISPVARVQLEFTSRDCATTARTSINGVPKQQREALRHATITVESIEGTTATVRFSPKLRDRDDMKLVKRQGQWFVNPG